MKRIFSRQVITGSVAEVFRHDYHKAVNACMDRFSGLYYSNERPIDLSQNEPKSNILLPGWDMGKGNKLTLPWKVCECVVCKYGDNYVVAYTVWRSGILELVVSQIPIDVWEDESVNGINQMTEVFRISEGFNSRLRISDKLYWRQYDAASSSASYIAYEYDYSIGTVIRREESEQDTQTLSDMTTSHRMSHVVKLPKSGIWCIHIMPIGHNDVSPAIVICPGGPYLPIPDIRNLPELYQKLSENGYHVIIPLRRGIIGISQKWENALAGNYGIADVDDIVNVTKEMVMDASFNIDSRRVGIYGASYGGYSALLICGKHNRDSFFKSVVSQCGVYDLAEYPIHSSGDTQAIMKEYGNTTNYESYIENVRFVNPANYVNNWNVPVLLIHTIDDTATWFGQSVKAYNAALDKHKRNVSLVLAEGGHTYGIDEEQKVYDEILQFFNKNLRGCKK